ncbi:hypothetical protein DSCW_46490 [Desulfosarcina widdelii]|uniref:Uncharacterized protein n=1 Tax=Desulfosarcina widdelii TaxID=947919 RepID=A0A5K7Z5F2_9BACT|nr:hypothetical protein [Desulfosarcina widdelii]BBO77232.1 hypothetical protein DSCW_46490 [Desulfosarcina widdelii]
MKRKNPFIVSGLTAGMCAFGIFCFVHFCPTSPFNPATMIADHWLVVFSALILSALLGVLWTGDIFQSIMLALGGFFLLTGFYFMGNGMLDWHSPAVKKYYVTAKGKEYEDAGSKPGYWNYFLKGRTSQGQRFRFSTSVGHITYQEWETAKSESWDYYIEVHERPGAFGTTWREIKGLRRDHSSLYDECLLTHK